MSKLTLFSHHLEILCWTFLNHLLILNDCVDHTTVTEVDTENKINTVLKFSGQILKFVLILWFFPHYMENLCITFLHHLNFFVGYFLYIIITQIKIWNNNNKNLNSTFQILKENRPSCCRWRKIYRNHCLIGYICGWNIMQTWIVVSTANPVTEICNGQAYARCYLCLHLFPATNILN